MNLEPINLTQIVMWRMPAAKNRPLINPLGWRFEIDKVRHPACPPHYFPLNGGHLDFMSKDALIL